MPQGNPRLRKALAAAYSPFFGREINPDTEVVVTSGANEGIYPFISPASFVTLSNLNG